MSEQTISAISIIPLLMGSILFLAAGSGLIQTKYALVTGLLCFSVYSFVEVLSRKPDIKINQRWKLLKNTKLK